MDILVVQIHNFLRSEQTSICTFKYAIRHPLDFFFKLQKANSKIHMEIPRIENTQNDFDIEQSPRI